MRIARSWAGAVLALVGLLSGCANRSPFNQEFVEVRTPNFVMTSSLGEEATIALARQLEFFRAGVLSVFELPEEPSGGRPSRVIAFDGRSVGRPFAMRGETAYLMPTVDGSAFVFRAAGTFSERANPDLRHRYAHRMLRDRVQDRAPLWFEEGISQVAGTIEERGRGVRIGGMRSEFRDIVLDWRVDDLTSDFWRSDLSDETEKQRRDFEARAWAVVHTLAFAEGAAANPNAPFTRYRQILATGDKGDEREARGTLGLGTASFTARVYDHLESKRIKVRHLGLQGWDPTALEIEPLAPAESRARLGRLALELGKSSVARDYFERALAAKEDHALAQAGMAHAAALDGRFDEVESWARRALATGEGDSEVQIRVGDACRLAGLGDPDAGRRDGWLEGAREHYSRALEIDRRSARARVGMGATLLAQGADPDQVRPWFAAAQALRPGSLEIELWLARTEAAAGAGLEAEEAARSIASRTHWRSLDRQARELIAEISEAGRR